MKRLGNNGSSCLYVQPDNCPGLEDLRADLTGSQLKTFSSHMPFASVIQHSLLQ